MSYNINHKPQSYGENVKFMGDICISVVRCCKLSGGTRFMGVDVHSARDRSSDI